MPAQIPSEEEVLSYFDKLSNWGRWGDDDEHGTLNLLSNEKTLQAVSLGAGRRNGVMLADGCLDAGG